MKTSNLFKKWEPEWLVDFLFIDPTSTESETVEKCQSVLKFQPASVWVKPCYVQTVVTDLRNRDIRIGTIIGSQDGSNTTQIKVAQAKRALTEGATILALPVNVGYVRELRFEALAKEIHAVSGIAHMNHAIIEVMFKLEWLQEQEILSAVKSIQRTDPDIISIPINSKAGSWHLDLITRLKDAVEKPVEIKAYVQNPSTSDLTILFASGLSRLGIVSYDSQTTDI